MQLLVQQLSPETSNHGFGIVTLKTEAYVLQAYRPETGVQFFVTADLKTENLASFLVRIPPITIGMISQDPFYFRHAGLLLLTYGVHVLRRDFNVNRRRFMYCMPIT